MTEFATRMRNQLRFSDCDAPHQPLTKAHEETLDVRLDGDLLTITEVCDDGSLGNRIYARRTLDIAGTAIFMILPRLPSGTSDGFFFPALGTVALPATLPGAKRSLAAVGTDSNSGHCRGWIFEATEI
jgi:hypothetical protein